MKNNIRYIVVHSSHTLPTEMYISVPFHYVIHRNGKVITQKKLNPSDACLQVAYLGGIDSERNSCDTKTVQQSNALFNLLLSLREQHPKAKIVGADEIFGKNNYPGFDVKEWLQNHSSNVKTKTA